jgi:uncharacterized protein (TIGR03437 family)
MRLLALLLLGAAILPARVAIPISFEPNRGQAASTAEFVTRAPGYALNLHSGTAEFVIRGSRVTATPLGARASRPQAEQLLPATTTYLVGEPSRWVRNLPSYGRVRYPGIYPGVDLLYYGTAGELEYDFALAPGADPRQIRLGITGARRLSIDAKGDLIIETPAGPLRQRRPVAYQEIGGIRHPVAASYVLQGSTVRFQVGKWDRRQTLVIDPALTWAGYTGTATNTIYDDAQSVAVDGSGNVYVAGITVSSAGDDDTFIVKLDPNGAPLKRIFLGGEGDDDGYGLAVDSTGAVYVTGSTTSNQWQIDITHASAGTDAFYAKINSALDTYVYVGYFGGNGTDVGYACALDSSNNLYFGGVTNSTTFPVTRTAAQSAAGGGYDAFLVKLDTTGALAYGTYLGGSGDDYLYSLALDAAGAVFVTGQAGSSNMPVTAGAFQSAIGGGVDAFVAKYSTTGSLTWLTYLGGSGDDEANSIAVDASGSPVVTGATKSTNFPTASPYQAANAGGARDIFVTKFASDGSKLAWSTYLGGSGDEIGNAIALDNSGNVYTGGTTTSTDFPSNFGWQSTNRGGVEGTVTGFSADGASLIFSSYIGGTSSDFVNALAVNCTAGLIAAGSTQSTNFPSTLGAAPNLAYTQGAAIGYAAKIAAGTANSTIAQGGIVNAANGAAAAVAQGSLVSIYGTNLAGSTASATSTPLPTTLNGVTVTVNGATVPLLFVSPGQINFQLPFEAATGTASATVNGGCGASTPVTFPVALAAPYLLLGGTGDAITQNQDFSFNSESNPAPKGTIVTVYLIGIGPLDGQVATGAATPASLFNARLPFKALIGGFDTSVKFLGMTPGFVGLAQANLEIPNLSPGKYPVVVTVNGVDSNAASIYVQ